MTISIKHKFVNPKSDTADGTVTRASNWNDEHELTLAQNRVLGRISAANGPVEELTGDQIRTISDTPQAGVLVGVNTRTAPYTLVASDRGKIIEMNVAGANTVTIPNETGIGGVNFPIGTLINVVQFGTGQTTLLPAAGVTARSVTGGLSTSTRYGSLILYKRASNDWFVIDQTSAYLDGRVDALETITGSFFYQGGQATNPTLRNDGSALQTGDLYYNTVNDRMRVYEIGTGWIDYEASAQAAATTATTQAGIATAQASTATAQAATATSQATAATNARTAAELARDASFTSANVYASVAAGLAAVIVGGQFNVVAGEEIIRYRVDAGPVATEIARYPSADILDRFIPESRVAFAVTDSNGKSALVVRDDGGFETEKLIAREAVSFTADSRYAFALADANGNIILGVNAAGQLVADFSLVQSTPATQDLPSKNYDYDINHVFNYGQSLSVGQALPVQSGTQAYDNLMFYRGMRPQYDYPSESAATWYGSLVPAIEIVSPNPTYSSDLGETPSTATGDAVKQLILSEDGRAYTDHDYKLLLSAPGFGATTISQLSKGTTHYARMVEQAQYGKTLANASGKTYAVQAVTWTQGESDYISDTTRSTYLARLNNLITDLNVDLKAATGQTKDVKLISYQVASHIHGAADDVPDIGLAQLDCEESNPLCYIAAPTYHLPYSDGFHLTGVGSRWLGGYYGLAYKRIVIDQVDWKPLKPLSSVKQGTILEVRFHVPAGRLVFDTTTVSSRPNMGFELVNSAGGSLMISSVQIVDFDRVRIVAAATIPAGAKLRYAWSGSSNVGQGNLRDTQGNTIVFDPSGINKPLHNWCVIFEREI